MRKSTISVVVPIYNVEKYLKRCIDSILSQSFSDFELILVDDGSPDDSGLICDKYAASDSRVTVIHQKNGGLSAARNAGIKYALKTGSEWLTFIDSDDWVHPDYLHALYNAAEQLKTDIAVCSFQRTTGEVLPVAEPIFSEYSPEELWCQNRVVATIACGKIYRIVLFRDVRFPLQKIHEDEYTTYKLLFSCKTVAATEANMYYYYQNPNGIMCSDWSPKKLFQSYALKEQAQFFLEHGYHSAWETSERNYLRSLAGNFRAASEKRAYVSEKKQIKAVLKKEFRKSKNALGLNIQNAVGVYLVLFPLRTKLYRLFSSVRTTLKTEGIKGLCLKIRQKVAERKAG